MQFLSVLKVGYSDNKYAFVEPDITIEDGKSTKNNVFILKAADKQKLGEFAGKLSKIRQYNKYKGYGILMSGKKSQKKYIIKEIKKSS